MPIIATNEGNFKRELIPSGNYAARCYAIVDLGTQEDTWKGEKKFLRRVRISWEIPEVMRTFDEAKGPQPAAISKEYTLSTGEKANLRKMLASWRGEDFTKEEAEAFDVTVLVGKCCMLNLIHKTKQDGSGDQYEDIGSVSRMPKGLKCGPAINKPYTFEFDKFDALLLECLPAYIKEKIKLSPEYKKAVDPSTVDAGAAPSNEPDDDLPF